MNKVVLIGRLTRDPELRYTQETKAAVCNFSIAVDRPFNSNSQDSNVDFINIVVWNKQAENCKTYLSKGSQVGIEGRIQIRNYEGQDGQKKYVTEVVANSVEFLGSRNSGNTESATGVSSASHEPTPYDFKDDNVESGTNVEKNPYADFSENIEISDDELPF